MKAKRAALYVRVSSEEQNTGAQERPLREYVQRRGWKLQQIDRDKGVSGASSNRPALNELMKVCRRGSIDVLVVWKFDRFARSLKQLMSGLETCRALGIDFVSVTEAVDTSLTCWRTLLVPNCLRRLKAGNRTTARSRFRSKRSTKLLRFYHVRPFSRCSSHFATTLASSVSH